VTDVSVAGKSEQLPSPVRASCGFNALHQWASERAVSQSLQPSVNIATITMRLPRPSATAAAAAAAGETL